ncbi:putative peptidoglycan endopeptidase LytE precursor [compost metagenome]
MTVGRTLTIPGQRTASDLDEHYIVQPGDSLYSVAKKFQTTVNELKSINSLTSNLLFVGQSLQISTNQTRRQEHIVTPADSLYSLAKRYGVSASQIKDINALENEMLSIGQSIKIPI